MKWVETGVKQGWAFSQDLFSLYDDAIRRKLEMLSGYIIVGRNLNIIRNADYILLMEGKLQQHLGWVVEEIVKKN